MSPGSIIQVGGYSGTVISFTQNSPLETLVFIIDDIENAITITSSDIITLPDLIGNVNGNAFTTPGGVGIPRFINGKHSKQQTTNKPNKANELVQHSHHHTALFPRVGAGGRGRSP